MQARQGKYLPILQDAISLERLGRFQQNPGDTDRDIIACYLWNMALSEALYPSLQALEVALRNSLHAAATRHYGTDMWMDPSRRAIRPQDHWQIQKAFDKVRPNVTAGRVIHAFNFGF